MHALAAMMLVDDAVKPVLREKLWALKMDTVLTQVNGSKKCTMGGNCKGGLLTQVVLSTGSTVHVIPRFCCIAHTAI